MTDANRHRGERALILRLALHYGHRGLWLIVMGSIWCIFGVGIVLGGASDDRPFVLHQMLPDGVQASAWALTGAYAIWHGLRGPGRDDSSGHVALYLVPAAWTASFAASVLIWYATGSARWLGFDVPREGYDRGWYSALLYAIIVAMIRLVSSWANPSAPTIPVPELPELPDLDGGSGRG